MKRMWLSCGFQNASKQSPSCNAQLRIFTYIPKTSEVNEMIREEVIRNGAGKTVCHLDAKSRTIEIVKCGWKTTVCFPAEGDPIVTDCKLNPNSVGGNVRDSFNRMPHDSKNKSK